MKKQNPNVCPGCGRHCTADAPRCKYGRAYFAKLAADTPKASHAEPERKYKHKWERDVAPDGVLWTLLSTSRKIKRALHARKITEAQLLSVLDEPEQLRLQEALSKMSEYLKKNVRQ